MRSAAILLAGILGAGAVQAASVQATIDITFDAEKTAHACYPEPYGPREPDGSCWPFNGLNFGETYQGHLTVSSDDWRLEPDGSLSLNFEYGDASITNCSIGSAWCWLSWESDGPSELTVGPGGVSGLTADYSYATIFDGTVGGSGWWWVRTDSGSGPSGSFYFVDVEFALSNIEVDGIPVAPVPLPAGILLLASALAAPFLRWQRPG